MSNKGLKVLCDCLKCKRSPLSRNLVSISTRSRHRKKHPQNKNTHKSNNDEQELSIDEQELSINEQELSIDKQDMIDIEQESSNEADLELYSNYELDFQEYNENLSDNDTLTDSDSISNSKLSKDNDTIIQLPSGFSEALRLLEIKAHSNMTNDMYSEIMDAFNEQNISLYCATKKLSSLVSIDPIWIDCCLKSCCAFTGNLKDLKECPACGEARYKKNSKKKVGIKKMAFFPLKDRDIALTASLDGYNIFKQKTDDYWIILFINANLQRENRVKRNNLLIGALIPGPSAPGNLNSFLRPVIDELKELENGFKCHDSYTNQDFILHCSVVSWSGNTPALAKLMCTTGHNSYQGCRYCNICGIWENHVYFPSRPLKNKRDGPCWCTWQFPIERLCGMLILLVHSKLHPYNNLANQIILRERLNHLKFIDHIYQQVYPLQNKRNQYNNNMIYTNLNYEEKFYYPIVNHYLNKSMAAFKNRLPEFEIQEFYGRVEYFFVHQFNGNTHMMAFIQWTQEINKDEYGLKSFRKFGIKQFMDVRVIDRCVEFFECNNILFIIDKKVDDSDDSYIESSSEDN
ncbi:23008_t:CDS:2, partial [Gigaspora rosea]